MNRRNSVPLRLHIPEPGGRPGDRPDFSGVALPPVGAMLPPENDTPAAEMRDMAKGLVRVLAPR